MSKYQQTSCEPIKSLLLHIYGATASQAPFGNYITNDSFGFAWNQPAQLLWLCPYYTQFFKIVGYLGVCALLSLEVLANHIDIKTFC